MEREKGNLLQQKSQLGSQARKISFTHTHTHTHTPGRTHGPNACSQCWKSSNGPSYTCSWGNNRPQGQGPRNNRLPLKDCCQEHSSTCHHLNLCIFTSKTWSLCCLLAMEVYMYLPQKKTTYKHTSIVLSIFRLSLAFHTLNGILNHSYISSPHIAVSKRLDN